MSERNSEKEKRMNEEKSQTGIFESKDKKQTNYV